METTDHTSTAKRADQRKRLEDTAESIRVFGKFFKHSSALIAILIAGVGGVIAAVLAFPKMDEKVVIPDSSASVARREIIMNDKRKTITAEPKSYSGSWYDDSNNLIEIVQSGKEIRFKSVVPSEIGPIEMSGSGTLENEIVDIQAGFSTAVLGKANDSFPVRISFLNAERALLTFNIFGLSQTGELVKKGE